VLESSFRILKDAFVPESTTARILPYYACFSVTTKNHHKVIIQHMRYEDLNWMDIENYLKAEDRLILVLGACEQHGYLSLLSDVKIPLALADAASQQTGVLIAPPLNFGISPYFLSYPGTLSLRVSTLLDLTEDLVRSAYSQGFHRILVLNGHGGNDPARARLYELAGDLQGLRVAWYAWWQAHSVEAAAQKYGLRSFHAGWIEAFPFTRVSDLPEGEKIPPAITGLLGHQDARSLYGDGVFGGPYQVDAAISSEIFNAALQDILHLLQFDGWPS
jgi:creatinine amidohydrolase